MPGILKLTKQWSIWTQAVWLGTVLPPLPLERIIQKAGDTPHPRLWFPEFASGGSRSDSGPPSHPHEQHLSASPGDPWEPLALLLAPGALVPMLPAEDQAPACAQACPHPLEVTGRSVSVHLAPLGHSSSLLLLDPETPPSASWRDSLHPTSFFWQKCIHSFTKYVLVANSMPGSVPA